jgi:hypothetical protein
LSEQREDDAASPRRTVQKTSGPTWHLCVIIYGSPDLFEAIGKFADTCEIYLQDPEHCDRNVEYRNPHRLSRRGEKALYTQSLPKVQTVPNLQRSIVSPFDLLGVAEECETLQESVPHPAVRTSLFKSATRPVELGSHIDYPADTRNRP